MANFETVGLIGPRSEQREPKEKKKDMWDQLKDGLDIANGVLGIGVNYSTWEKNRVQTKALEDEANGYVTTSKKLDYLKEGLDPVQPGADGNYPPDAITYKERRGQETATGAFVRSQKPKSPVMDWVTNRDAQGREVSNYVELTPGLKAVKEPLPQAAPKPEKTPMGWVGDGKGGKVWGPLTEGVRSIDDPKPAKPEGSDLSLPAKTEVTALAGKNASKLAIRNQIAAQMEEFKNAKTEDDKIRIGRQMIKTLNSSEGADAVGAEEVKRLGSALEYQMFNFTGPGPAFGKDVPGFEAQVTGTLNSLDGAIEANQRRMDELMQGGAKGATSEYKPGQTLKLKDGRAFRVLSDGHTLEEIKGQ